MIYHAMYRAENYLCLLRSHGIGVPVRTDHDIHASQYINAEEGADCYYLNGWMQEKDGSYMEHSGGNPNFSTMLYIDRERNIGTFAATNISSDSPVKHQTNE